MVCHLIRCIAITYWMFKSLRQKSLETYWRHHVYQPSWVIECQSHSYRRTVVVLFNTLLGGEGDFIPFPRVFVWTCTQWYDWNSKSLTTIRQSSDLTITPRGHKETPYQNFWEFGFGRKQIRDFFLLLLTHIGLNFNKTNRVLE